MPTATLVRFPPGYGTAKHALAWPEIRRRLEEAPAYWLATCRADGRPHVVPLDGVWVDDVWWYGGAPGTVHIRNVAARPQAVMHLADPMQAVIVEGTVRRVTLETDRAQSLADASNTKYAHYGMDNTADTYRTALGLFPERVLAWTSFPTDATRFEFDDPAA
jgi:predicted pyridoxine 5'-phosphate oxidase superfamily flavin-nucleotide-binding protein